MKYGWGGRPDGYPLSLKDACLIDKLRQLRKMGVACLKLEGRMKRAEYVAVITRIYATVLKEDRLPTDQELRDLEAAFSRQGFTQGYFEDRTGPDMFGVRPENTPEPKELFAQARQTYVNQESPLVDVNFYAMVRKGEPVRVGVEDPDGRGGHPPREMSPRPPSPGPSPPTGGKAAGPDRRDPLPVRKGEGPGGGGALGAPLRPQRPAPPSIGGPLRPAPGPSAPGERGISRRGPV